MFIQPSSFTSTNINTQHAYYYCKNNSDPPSNQSQQIQHLIEKIIPVLLELIKSIQADRTKPDCDTINPSILALDQDTLDSLSAAWRHFNVPKETTGIYSVIDTNGDGKLSVGDTLKFSRYDGSQPETITSASLTEDVLTASIPFYDPRKIPSGRFSYEEDNERSTLIGQALLAAGFKNTITIPKPNDDIEIIIALNDDDEIPTENNIFRLINDFLVDHEIKGKSSVLREGELKLTITVGIPLIAK